MKSVRPNGKNRKKTVLDREDRGQTARPRYHAHTRRTAAATGLGRAAANDLTCYYTAVS